MGPVALELAEKQGLTLKNYIDRGVRVANGHFSPIFNAVDLNFKLGSAQH